MSVARWLVAVPASLAATFTGAIVVFLVAATIGALLPGPQAADVPPGGERDILVLESPLHTDIVLPNDPDVRVRFAFLRGTNVPFDHSDLRWLSFGWGSRAFYTTAGSYADIAPGAVWRAATGDAAVMRVVGLPEVRMDGIRRLSLDDKSFRRLLAFIVDTFEKRGDDVVPVDASIGPDDAFFQAKGRFHLFNPCNEWTRKALVSAGVPAGRWTPTTFSLALALDSHRERSSVQP